MPVPTPPSSSDVLLANWAIISFILLFVFGIIAAVLAITWRNVKKNPKVMNLLTNFMQMVEDYTGEPARPGVPERLGWNMRLQNIEVSQTSQTASLRRLEDIQKAHGEQLDSVHHEVNFNHGGSVKDAAVEAKHGVAEVKTEMQELRAGLDTITELISAKVKPLLSIEHTVNHNEVRPIDGTIED
ncbi:hypothetical protein SAMN04489743_2852 [Pseudarthrobacter equi]|uniref:Uncharacterized protein n=1 Tax=Pseudarthrobacter equi TaxID=728066 RepID=A0A1H2A9F4_9MICC|nr:hypothetical protein [Pseudarthrobacter equi]SDT42402.1 hypothetical protein SAMN04489743_2852 [Pseudarthrobacter equi]